MPSKPAKVLSNFQAEAMLRYLATTRYPVRNRLIFLLSVDAGLKAGEIASLSWWMTNDSDGDIGYSLCFLKKDGTGRMIPVTERLREALIEYRRTVPHAGPLVISTERALASSPHGIVNMFARWFKRLGFQGCSSHTGRKSFVITKGQSCSSDEALKDIQKLVGHKHLRTTRLYVGNGSVLSILHDPQST
jgi:integrase/recombinase XerD